jgi:predicted RNA binding protein YcfA (HicA-like mRNA interferase family)
LGKLRVFSGKELSKLLEKNGFLNVRQRGSHMVMQKKTGQTTITVPVPNHPSIRIGTLQSIIRQSQLSKGIFEVKKGVK